MGKTTQAFDIYKMQQQEKSIELNQKVFTMIATGLKSLCDKVVGGCASKVINVKTELVEDIPNDRIQLKSIGTVEVCDSEGFKVLDVPVSGVIDSHELITLTYPEQDILKSKIAELKVDNSLKSADKIKSRMEEISKFKQAEIDNYWNRVNSTELPKAGEVSSTSADKSNVGPQDGATSLTLVKVQYPESFALGQIVPISGIDYKITGENGGEWVLTKVNLTSEVKEDKKESLNVESKLEVKAEEVVEEPKVEEKKEEVKTEVPKAVSAAPAVEEKPVEVASSQVSAPAEVKVEVKEEVKATSLPEGKEVVQTLDTGEKIIVSVVPEEIESKDKGVQG